MTAPDSSLDPGGHATDRAPLFTATINKCSTHDATHPLQRLQRPHHRRLLCADGARAVADPEPVAASSTSPMAASWPSAPISPTRSIPYVGFWGALIVAPVLTALIGLIIERVLIRRALRARSALQPAADLRPRLHVRGWHALHLGRADACPSRCPDWLSSPLSSRLLLHHRLPPVHGGCWSRSRWAVLFLVPEPHAARHAHPRRHARPGDGLGRWA